MRKIRPDTPPYIYITRLISLADPLCFAPNPAASVRQSGAFQPPRFMRWVSTGTRHHLLPSDKWLLRTSSMPPAHIERSKRDYPGEHPRRLPPLEPLNTDHPVPPALPVDDDHVTRCTTFTACSVGLTSSTQTPSDCCNGTMPNSFSTISTASTDGILPRRSTLMLMW